jgi:hypothetical protein
MGKTKLSLNIVFVCLVLALSVILNSELDKETEVKKTAYVNIFKLNNPYIQDNDSEKPPHRSLNTDYVKVVVTYTPNTAPTNGVGSITDMDDTDNIYAQRKFYTGSSTCSDADGYDDIDYCEFRLKQGASTRAIFRYDEDTDTFSVEFGSGEWDLDGSSSAVESGTDITISWKFAPQWDATSEDDLEIELYVVDAASAGDTDTAQSDYVNVVIDLVTTFSLDDDRGNISQSITALGTVTYANSSFYPPDAEFTSVSVYDSANNNEGDSSVVNGDWSVTFDAPAAVGTDTYNLYINMADADYSDGEEVTPTDTFITDQVVFKTGTTLDVTDGRVNADGSTTGEWYAELMLDYDDSEIESGTINLNSGTMSWDAGQGRWKSTTTSTAVQSISRNIASVSGLSYGVTALNSTVTSDSETIIYDQIEVSSVAFDDSRIDVFGSAEVRYALQYDYDDVAFDDTKGTVTGFSWDAGGPWWDKSITGSSSVASTNYDETNISFTDSTYGLTAIEDDAGTDIVTDRIKILTLSAVDADISVGTEGTWYATAELEYDNHSLDLGDTLTLSGYAFSWDAVDNRFEATDTKNTPQAVTINAFDSGSEATYGITAGNINNLSQSIGWQTVESGGGGGGMPSVWLNSPEAPESGFRILINNNDKYTDSLAVNLDLFGGPEAARMAISNFPDFRDAGQETYQTTKSWDLCQGRENCSEGEYTVYVKFYASWGTASEVVSDTIIFRKEKPVPEKIVEEIKKIPEILEPLIPEILKPEPPEEVIPPEVSIEELVPKEAPSVLKSQWTLLTYTLENKPFVKFTLAPLPREFQKLAEKFPELEKTFTEVGIQQLIDVEKLRPVKLTLPGLTERVGLPTAKVEPGKLALPQGIPVAQLPSEIKEKIPSEIVFAKTGGELIDFSVALSVTEKGETEQKITTISGKPLNLVVKPDQPVKSIKGYVVFKSKPKKITALEIPLTSLLASVFFSNPIFAKEHNPREIEEVLVLMEFEYTDPDGDGIYTADIQAPLVEGEYEIITVMDYEDPVLGQKEIRLIAVVDPEGYIYTQLPEGKLRITGAVVYLYWLNSETKEYELWPAKEYQQENPQITDDTGKYSFLVPPGTYYLKVEHPNYPVYQSETFMVKEGSSLHINIELKTKFWWLKILDWKIILLILVILLLFYNFYNDRIRERRIKKMTNI